MTPSPEIADAAAANVRVLTIIDSLAVGGAEQSLATVTPHLVKRGIDMHVGYLLDRRGVAAELAHGGAQLHSLAGSGGRLGGLRRARRLIRAVQPDIVHTTLYEADIVGRVAGRIAGCCVVSSFVTESYGVEHYMNPEYRSWKVRAAQLVDALTARAVTKFHAVSAASADAMARRLRIPRGKIVVIPRGRDPATLGRRTAARRSATRAALGLDPETPLVLAAARHYRVKGLDVLIEAFAAVAAALPSARLVIAGRAGPATPELRTLIANHDLGTSVRLLGYRDDVPDLMCAADIVALPSRAEGSPGTLIEAMALEVPVVASSIPAVVEAAGTSPITALLCDPGSVEAMAEAIVTLLHNRALAAELAAAARLRFEERYTIDAVAAAIAQLYQDCLAES